MTDKERDALSEAVEVGIEEYFRRNPRPPCYCRDPESTAHHNDAHRLVDFYFRPTPEDIPDEVVTDYVKNHRHTRAEREMSLDTRRTLRARVVEKAVDLILLAMAAGVGATLT